MGKNRDRMRAEFAAGWEKKATTDIVRCIFMTELTRNGTWLGHTWKSKFSESTACPRSFHFGTCLLPVTFLASSASRFFAYSRWPDPRTYEKRREKFSPRTLEFQRWGDADSRYNFLFFPFILKFYNNEGLLLREQLLLNSSRTGTLAVQTILILCSFYFLIIQILVFIKFLPKIR